MRNRIKYLLGLILFTFSLAAPAKIVDALDGMWQGTITNPSAYSTNRGHTIDGGRLRLKSNRKPFNIAGLEMPYLKMGCGGIDAFGGSFSFINGDEFRQLLRQIASQSLAYAFQLAVKAMCDDCFTIMNDVQNKIQKANDALRNTCELAKPLAVSALTAVNRAVESEKLAGELENQATASDWFETQQAVWNDSKRNIKDVDCVADDNAKPCPNATNKIGKDDGTLTELFERINITSKNDQVEWLVNFLGDSTYIAETAERQPDLRVYEPQYTFEDLLDLRGNDVGSSNSIWWVCETNANDQCISFAKGEPDFEGVTPYLSKLLYGDEECWNDETTNETAPDQTLCDGSVLNALASPQVTPNSTVNTSQVLAVLGLDAIQWKSYLQGDPSKAKKFLQIIEMDLRKGFHKEIGIKLKKAFAASFSIETDHGKSASTGEENTAYLKFVKDVDIAISEWESGQAKRAEKYEKLKKEFRKDREG